MTHVLIASGGTVAPIDAVRQITNTSTGRLGAMIVEAALERGCLVTHLRTPSAQLPFERSARFRLDVSDPAVEIARLVALRERWLAARHRLHPILLPTGTVAEYAEILRRTLAATPIDVAFLPIAASDYEPIPLAGKLPSDLEEWTVRCRKTPKVIRQVRDWSPSVYLVGFKLLANVPHDELIAQAHAACLANRADLTVANDQATVNSGNHTLHLVRPGHPTQSIPPGEAFAAELVDRVLKWAIK